MNAKVQYIKFHENQLLIVLKQHFRTHFKAINSIRAEIIYADFNRIYLWIL